MFHVEHTLKTTDNKLYMNNSFSVEGNIVDVVKRLIFKGKITVLNGRIFTIEECNVESELFILPGLIDSHIHIESSMMTPSSFAELAVRKGTVAVVSDPHEICNVLGVEGLNFMLDDAKKANLKFFFGAPSCVPATNFESSGAEIDYKQIENLMKRDDIWFLSEMMNFPSVINNDFETIEKLNSAKKYKKPIDGHAPMISGNNLKSYFNSGISTDHECTDIDEAIEKIKNNVKIQIREGSAAKNFDKLASLIDLYPESVMFCSDDLHPDDLYIAHIDKFIRKSLKFNLNIFNILRASSYNPKYHYNLPVGLLQIGDSADFIVVDTLEDFNVQQTYINGEKIFDYKQDSKNVENTIKINKFRTNLINEEDIIIEAKFDKIKVIVVEDGNLFTKSETLNAKIVNNKAISDIDNDIIKIVVLNRYSENSLPAVAFIKNFGLKSGALAASIAHDSHNIIAIGVDDKSIIESINKIIELKGGIVAHNNEKIDFLQLDIAGLMSSKDGVFIANSYSKLNEIAYSLGSTLKSPFMTMSFMALLVIPELKISDKGLFDSINFEFTNLFYTNS